MKTAGVLALQGDFEAHAAALKKVGLKVSFVRSADGLREVDGLVLPGGESTTMLKLLAHDGMMAPLRAFAETKPVFGTCAGVILLAREVSHPVQESLGVLDVSVERNAYGRQNESRIVALTPEEPYRQRTGADRIEAVFIRAPILRRTGPGVTVLARYQDTPVLVEQGNILAATFHPELTASTDVHALFAAKL
ncbi:MAG: pyridoxal 5'-phosphate synthase glutaminase subunit PdxT [Alphaproteobacteria bacterium]|nr:pyridoxal 5'-phosphate synthase glutaminase subunit PdxT [Alphaproteobacteria bacterium]